MGQSELSNSEEFNEEPAEETQEPDEPTEQPTDQDSGEEQFYDLDITDINRDTLTPEMRSAYDNMLEMHGNMQAAYTQKTQNISALSRDAEAWRAITNHPQLSKRVYDMIYKVENNIPLDGATQQQEASPPPDPQEDPEAYITNIVNKAVSDAVSPLLEQMGQVTGFVRGNQANLEFQNLQAKYPAAKGIGLQSLRNVQSQYTGPSGNSISMEEALVLMARDDPSLLTGPQTTFAKKPRRPSVEQPRQTRTTTTETPLPKGVKDLMAQARELEKSGKISLSDRAASALAKIQRTFNPEG